MTKAVALVLLALCAAVSAIQFADEFEPHAQRQAFATNDRVDAMRSAAMRDDAERVSRLDTDTYGGHTVVHSHHALPLHLRRGHGKAVQIRRFNAEKQKFDLRRAEGVWYQIAVNRDFYNRYEKSCSCPVALVRVNSDTESMIQYTCVNKTGDLTIVRGTKRMESPGKFATTLKEKLIGEKVIRADDDKKLKETVHDEILALDDDMQWKIMENAKDKGIFIYSRKPTIDSRLFHDMISFIQKHTEGKLSAKDMKLFKHEETCSKLRSVIREFSGKYDEKGKGKIEETQRKHSPHRHFQDASSGAEPRTAKAGEQPKQKLDLSMLKGQWYEIARSRAASQSTEHGCACGLAFFDVTENAFNSQYACLNTTAKEDDSKVATASGHAVMDPNQEGVFRAKMLSKVPGKLSDDESKERKLILLALGDNFAATLEPDRKVVHIVARNTTMEKDLVGALAEMLQSIGIDPKDLDKVDQASGTCSTFHEKAKSKFGAKAKSSEHGLDTKKGLQQTGAADTSDAKVSGSSTLHDDKGEDKSKLLGKEGAGDDREHSQQRSFLDADEGVENRRIVMEILPSSVNAQGLRSTEVQPLQRVDLIPANFAVDDEGVENRRIVMEILPSSVSAQPLRSTEVQPLSRVELVPVTSFAADDEGVENRRIVMELAPSYTGSQAQPLRSGEVQPLMNIETAAPTQQRAAAAAAPAPDDTTPPPLDATILGGNWFDIAVSQDAYGMYHSGCECMQRYIQALDSNKLHVVGGCMNKTDSQLVTCVGGGVQDPASPGLFRLQELDKQPYGLTATEKAIHEVVVLAVGKDFAVLAEPAINSAWILSRAPTMAADLYDRLINLLVKIGFAKDSFRKFNQALPECQAVTNQMQAIGKQAAEKPNAPAAPTAAAAPAPAAPAAAAPTASAAPAAPIAPAASAAPPIAPRSRLPQRPALIGEQPLASGEQQQYAEQQNPAYYGGDYYATEQPLAGDDQYYGDQ